MTEVCFAYGSNLDVADWTAWCGSQGLDPAGVIPTAAATLPDVELVFDYHSARRGGGVLDLCPRVGQAVDGMLCRVTPEGWQALNQKEGAPSCYQRRHRRAILRDGSCIGTAVYEVVPERKTCFIKPTADYRRICLRGRRAHGLGTGMLEQAAEGRKPDPAIEGVFVYGTLMQGQHHFPSLATTALEAIVTATVKGRLLDLGPYPGLILEEKRTVRGEFAVPGDLDRTLRQLDAIEDAEPDGGEGGLYRRTLVEVEVGDGQRRRAWTYVMGSASPQGCAEIPSGCWRTHRGREGTAG